MDDTLIEEIMSLAKAWAIEAWVDGEFGAGADSPQTVKAKLALENYLRALNVSKT